MSLTVLADKLARKLTLTSWADLRDSLDMMTGSELDYHKLNILTDMVGKRLADDAREHGPLDDAAWLAAQGTPRETHPDE
jgi:hypothetical protein